MLFRSTPQQVQIALEDRQIFPNLKIGQIMAMRGWIDRQTADFFAEQLSLSSVIGNVPQTTLPSIEVPNNRVENYLIRNRNCEPTLLLNLYQQIWQQQEVMVTGSQAEKELIQSGLVVEDNRKLKIEPSCDRAYDESWIQQQLVRLQPYSKIECVYLVWKLPLAILIGYWRRLIPRLESSLF